MVVDTKAKTAAPGAAPAPTTKREVLTMSDTDSDAAKGAGREPDGSPAPPPGAAPSPPPGHWSPPGGGPGQQQPPGYWSLPQGEPGQPGYWSPPQGGAGQQQPPPPAYWPPPPPQGAPGQPPYGSWQPAAPAPPRRRGRGLVALVAAGAVVVVALGIGWGYATQRIIHSITAGQVAQNPIQSIPRIGGSSNNGSTSNGSSGSSSSGLPAQSGQANQPIDAQAVANKVSSAIVDINTIVASASGRGSAAAGTGMILTSDGEVLTNNHVVEQSTSIKVTIAGRSGSFNASVIGVDPSADVALIKIQGVSGLPTVQLADSSTLSVGQQVVAMGNAGGQGGAPSVTQGAITALDQTITASNDNGRSEQLNGLIESDATIAPGDSGGALVNSAGQVIGMITAGQATGFRQSSTDVGYAIPASNAISVVNDIRAGHASSTIFIGPTGHLGIGVQDLDPVTASRLGLNVSSGALVTAVESGSPAEQIGMTANSVITNVDGATINSSSDLTPALQSHKPGDKVKVTWVDQNGSSHTATATLTTGPVA
jgi:S1-C subfamily serine protease